MATGSLLVTIGGAATVIVTLLRFVFIYIDALIYALVGGVYEMSVQMYKLNDLITTMGGIISSVKQTVYSFLAVVMFFKIAFSFLEMLVDPTKIEDKQRGMGKVISSVIVCILLIIVVPVVFEQAYAVQTTVLDKHIIEKAVYGNEFSEEDNLGKELSLACWSVFLKPNNNTTPAYTAWQGVFGKVGGRFLGEWKIGKLFLHINDISIGNSDGNMYDLSYNWLISTIFGCYLLSVMITFAINVAYRSLKMIVLEIISPIAIISYIDPKSSKDGVFAKWVKEVMKTYLALFIRIFVLAIASVILRQTMGNLYALENFNFIQEIIIILAVISFIKSGPKFFDNIFGTELSKESETAFASNMLKGAVIASTAGATGLIGTTVLGKQAGLSGWELAKKSMAAGWEGVSKGYTAGSKNGLNLTGVVGAFGGLAKTRKDFGLPTSDERRELARAIALSDAAEKIRDNTPGFITIDPTNGKAIPDVSQYDTEFKTAGYNTKYVEGSDPNTRYFSDKKRKFEAVIKDLFIPEGMSKPATDILQEKIDAEYDEAMKRIALGNIKSTYERNADALSNISYDAAQAYGYRVGNNVNGKVISDETEALQMYRSYLEQNKATLNAEFNEATSVYNKAEAKTKKVEAKLNSHLASSIGGVDKRIWERYNKGERAKGRDKEAKGG